MERIKKMKACYIVCYILILSLAMLLVLPSHATGEVTPITELKNKLENISEEEKKVLSELFSLEQEIASLKADELKLSEEIKQLQNSIRQLESSIEEKQTEYDNRCDILRQVLVSHQRRGPASYLEILLQARDLSSFIKSLNIIKDISHNTNELLNELKQKQGELKEQKASLEQENALLVKKRDELELDIANRMQLQEQKEEYLAKLKQEGTYFEEQLQLVTAMWERCTKLLPELSREITDIIGGGYVGLEDLNVSFGFFKISGYIEEDTFNNVLSEHGSLAKAIFRFEDDKVLIEVPEERLLLIGNFEITGESEVSFMAEEGYFYDLPLEKSSIDEIFGNGTLTIDFNKIADDVITINFRITEVGSQEGSLYFTITPQF
ncbi:MAG: hypothetical protein GX757_04485 [Clostridiales bacterium]|nr:hypothetical protein [Clostridiales bacterium]